MTVSLPDLPSRIAALPRDHRGFPVPWFVAWIDGVPDFRVIGPGKIAEAYAHKKCWICGENVGKYMAFVIGPMCAINRVASEPPSHRECAEFAARVCPFLTRPKMRRNEKDLPEQRRDPAGHHISRNPGVALVWITKSYQPFRADGGVLFTVGDPIETLWFAEGRPAKRAEVLESINTGLPFLQEMAQRDGAHALAELTRMHSEALRFLPEEQAA